MASKEASSGATPLQRALAEVAAEVGTVPKLGRNDQQHYDYVRAEDLLRAVQTALSKRHIAVVNTQMHLISTEVRPSHKAGAAPKHHVIISVTAVVRLGEEEARFTGFGEGVDSGDKALAKAQTMAVKYMWAEAFAVSFGDDPEADASTDRDAAPDRPARAPSRAAAPEAKPLTPSARKRLLAKITGAGDTAALDTIRDADVLPLLGSDPESFELAKAAIVARRAELTARPAATASEEAAA